MDKDLILSWEQEITAAAISTNKINLQAASRRFKPGQPLYLVLLVTTTLADGGANTGTKVNLAYDDNALVTSPTVIEACQHTFAKAQAAAVAAAMKILPLPADVIAEQWMGVYYAPQGANLTGGKFSAWITDQPDFWVAAAAGFSV